MSRSTLWIALVAGVAAVELFVRFVLPFNLDRVLIVETLLFIAAGCAGFAIAARLPRAVGWRRALELTLSGALLLAAIRTGLWAAGGVASVPRANLVTGVVGGVAVAVVWWRRRRADRIRAPSS